MQGRDLSGAGGADRTPVRPALRQPGPVDPVDPLDGRESGGNRALRALSSKGRKTFGLGAETIRRARYHQADEDGVARRLPGRLYGIAISTGRQCAHGHEASLSAKPAQGAIALEEHLARRQFAESRGARRLTNLVPRREMANLLPRAVMDGSNRPWYGKSNSRIIYIMLNPLFVCVPASPLSRKHTSLRQEKWPKPARGLIGRSLAPSLPRLKLAHESRDRRRLPDRRALPRNRSGLQAAATRQDLPASVQERRKMLRAQ